MVRTMPIGKNRVKHHANYQAGFTYMGLLMVVALAGISMAGVGIVWHQDAQREREKELLFIGQAYRNAIGSYYENSPSTAKQFPQTLQDLILDTRFPSVKRHIRQLYADPFARDKDWNFVLQQGKIIGVVSVTGGFTGGSTTAGDDNALPGTNTKRHSSYFSAASSASNSLGRPAFLMGFSVELL